MGDSDTGRRRRLGVRAATAMDVPRLAEVLALAFFDDPVTRWHVPDDEQRYPLMRRFFEFNLENQFLPHGLVVTTRDLVAACAWLSPNTGDQGVEGGPDPGSVIAEIFGEDAWMVETILRLQEEHHPTEPHYYLQFMGVLPERQSQGIGSSIMQPVIDACDRERTPAYLDASSERSRDFYLRQGFEVIGDIQLPDGPGFWHMCRRPRPTRSTSGESGT